MTDNLPIPEPAPDTLTLAVWAAHAAIRRGLVYTDGTLRTGRLEARINIWPDGEWNSGWDFDTSGTLGDSREGYTWEPEAAVLVPA